MPPRAVRLARRLFHHLNLGLLGRLPLKKGEARAWYLVHARLRSSAEIFRKSGISRPPSSLASSVMTTAP
jgi:hypothetical protein